MSFLGLVAPALMTVKPGAEAWRWGLLLALAVFLVGWSALALWARGRLRSCPGAAALPTPVKIAIVAGGVVYVILVALCSVG